MVDDRAPEPRRFYGKYRGTVVSNQDPCQLGRVQVACPALFGDGRNNWALPCVPYAGNGVGLVLTPPVGANVWIECEAGDPQFPILAGCFWGLGEMPGLPAAPVKKVFQTETLTVSLLDSPRAGLMEINLTTPTGDVGVAASAAGLTISFGSVNVALGALSVSINDGALEVL